MRAYHEGQLADFPLCFGDLRAPCLRALYVELDSFEYAQIDSARRDTVFAWLGTLPECLEHLTLEHNMYLHDHLEDYMDNCGARMAASPVNALLRAFRMLQLRLPSHVGILYCWLPTLAT